MAKCAFTVVGIALCVRITVAKMQCNGQETCTYNNETCEAIKENTFRPACGFFCKSADIFVNEDCILPLEPFYCMDEDKSVEKWTFLRYSTLGAIMFYRATAIIRKGRKEPHSEPFHLHPEITKKMTESADSGGVGWIRAYFFAGCLFIQSEGVGLMIYFATSAALDNYSIFIVNLGHLYCKWVTMVALYSCALVTFLPNVVVAYYLQGRMYDMGNLSEKIGFVLMMVVVTGVFFICRLWLVYNLGWAAKVHEAFGHLQVGHLEADYRRVFVAAVVPPIVDAFQSMALIASSLAAQRWGEASAQKLLEGDLEYQRMSPGALGS